MNKSNQPIILYVLIGLLIVAIAIGPIYNAFTDDSNGDTPHEHAFDYNEVSEMGHEGTELIYRYHPDCGACQAIEADVNAFAESNAEDIPLQKVHVSHEENLPSGLERGTPTLLVIESGEIIREIIGANEIPEYFDSVNAGN